MGNFLGVLLIILFVVVAIPLAAALGFALFTAGMGLLYSGARSPRAPQPGAVAVGPPARRRGMLVLGGSFVLLLSLGCLSPVALFVVKCGPDIAGEYARMRAEEKERPALNAALEDARRFVLAERAYRTRSGAFGPPECLARPQACIPGYAGPAFLDPGTAAMGTRGGFVWSFHPGTRPDPPAGASTSGVASYALLGVRAERFDRAHSVCADSREPEGVPHAPSVCTFFGSELDQPAACPRDCALEIWSN